jgi:hypothetical protein
MNKIRRAYLVISLFYFATPALAAVTTEVMGNFSGECVAYARSRAPGLPSGLFSMADKRRIINAKKCKAGSVAIIGNGSVGHVAYVEKCDRDGKKEGITITEANWKAGKITKRKVSSGDGLRAAERELGIEGYWQR